MVLALPLITVLAVIAAPWLVQLYSTGWSRNDIEVATAFARLLLPQIFFYGVFALVSQVLNTRGRFGPPMFAPVLNNVVIIASALTFLAVAGTGTTTKTVTDWRDRAARHRHHGRCGPPGGRALARAAPVRCSPSAPHRPRGQGLGLAWALARWTILLVLVNQLGTLVVIRLATGINATSDADAGATVYQMAFTVFMLPQSVITVSLVTAMLPHLAHEAASGRLDVMRERIGWTLRTSGALIVPPRPPSSSSACLSRCCSFATGRSTSRRRDCLA